MVSVTREQARSVCARPGAEKVPVIWLLTRQSGIFDPDNDMPHALGEGAQARHDPEWGYISVQPYYRH